MAAVEGQTGNKNAERTFKLPWLRRYINWQARW